MRLLRTVLLLLAIVVVLAACGSDDDEGLAVTGADTGATQDTDDADGSTTEPTTSTPTTPLTSGPTLPPSSTTDDAPSTSGDTDSGDGGDGGDGEDGDSGGDGGDGDGGETGDGTGTVAVRLEEVQGFFIEGFEIGLRFETTDGEVIASTLWTDFVATIDNPTIEDFYESVLTQPVPAGEVVVLASVNIGIGPPPEVPDPEGPLRCRLAVDVPADGEVAVEVSFDQEDCLRLV